MFVYWVGCVCNQSWHVRTCLSNSWHKLQVAAFAQLVVVGRGSNTCICHNDFYDVWKYRTTHLHHVHVKTCSFLRTLWQVTSPGSTGTTRRQNSSRHSGRVPRLRDQRRGARCEEKQRSCYWRFFFILRVLYTTSTLPTGKQLTTNSTWRSCDVCVNQFAEKTGKMAGWRLDPAPRQCARTHFTSCAAVFGQTRHRSVAAATILARSRTVWLFPIPKA